METSVVVIVVAREEVVVETGMDIEVDKEMEVAEVGGVGVVHEAQAVLPVAVEVLVNQTNKRYFCIK